MRIFEQSMNIGQNFTGIIPTTTAVANGDIEKRWPIDNSGGLFDFDMAGPHYLAIVQLKLGGQTSWTLSLEDDTGSSIVLWSGTNETSFAVTGADEMIMLRNHALKLVTVGTTTVACKARIGVRRAGEA